MSTLIERLEARKAEIDDRLEAIIATADTEIRNVTDEEHTETLALLEERTDVSTKIEAAKAAEAVLAERGHNNPVPPPARTELRSEPYRKGGKESYVKDLYLATVKGERAAQQRLIENDRHREDKMAVRESRAMSTTAGAGGEFAPPLWQIDQFVEYKRPGRPLADLFNHETLPMGVSSINLPKVTTGALTGAQGSQNTAVANRDFVTSSVTGTVATVAGQVVISQQDIDQTPINLDSIVLADLARDYDLQLDTAMIAALAAVSGQNTITYTNASPTTGGVLNQIQTGIDQVHTGIYTPAKAIVMRPDRWGRILTAQDTQGRPLVLPNADYGAFNSLGLAEGQVPQGYAGSLRALAVILDASIPNNLGAGTNQDEIFVLDPSQVTLYESAPKAETFQQTYANQLSVLVRFYAYYSVIPNRLPKAISTLVGTGMIPQAYGV